MGDFLLDFRSPESRCPHGGHLRYFADTVVDAIERDHFSLFVARAASSKLWAPYENPDGSMVAVSGQVALDDSSWRNVRSTDPGGPSACEVIYKIYLKEGISTVAGLSGAFAIHLFDSRSRTYFLVGDSGGTLPVFVRSGVEQVLCSHADRLAESLGPSGAGKSIDQLDLVSMAEFLSTGVVTDPHSYHRGISSIDFGCVHSFRLGSNVFARETTKRQVEVSVSQPESADESSLADRLADAIVASTRKRTNPVLGRTAIALSGGLDSRAILCGAIKHQDLLAFCAYDKENAELKRARQIADAIGVDFHALKRSPEHYAKSAELGVRVSGGMGEISSNHFLGFLDEFARLGIQNLITGCYFDYLFKSLALDTRETRFMRREVFKPFSFETYLPHFAPDPRFADAIQDRLRLRFPREDRHSRSSETLTRNAHRRIFPLYREGDNAQRLVPLRLLNWCPVAADPEILRLSMLIPPDLKLNKRLFRRAVRQICGDAVSRIPDNNTGLPLAASPFRVGIYRYLIAARRWSERRSRALSTAESWPNWRYFILNSREVRRLWDRRNSITMEILEDVCGAPLSTDISQYLHRPTQYFMRLLTLKLWLDDFEAR